MENRFNLRFIKLMLLGAASFWFPDTLWHAVRGGKFGGLDVAIISSLMPLTLLATYVLLRKSGGEKTKKAEWVGR
jgi:hypothetical protein